MTTLQTFADALEDVVGKTCVSGITYTPLKIPAYKEVKFTLKIGSTVYTQSYKEMILSDAGRNSAIEKLTRKFMTYIMKEIFKYETV